MVESRLSEIIYSRFKIGLSEYESLLKCKAMQFYRYVSAFQKIILFVFL